MRLWRIWAAALCLSGRLLAVRASKIDLQTQGKQSLPCTAGWLELAVPASMPYAPVPPSPSPAILQQRSSQLECWAGERCHHWVGPGSGAALQLDLRQLQWLQRHVHHHPWPDAGLPAAGQPLVRPRQPHSSADPVGLGPAADCRADLLASSTGRRAVPTFVGLDQLWAGTPALRRTLEPQQEQHIPADVSKYVVCMCAAGMQTSVGSPVSGQLSCGCCAGSSPAPRCVAPLRLSGAMRPGAAGPSEL